jgi:hypothetical protein
VFGADLTCFGNLSSFPLRLRTAGWYPRLHHVRVHRTSRILCQAASSRPLLTDSPALPIFQCQIDTERNHVYFYPLQVSEMKTEWPESGRSREWVSVEEAIARVCKCHRPSLSSSLSTVQTH